LFIFEEKEQNNTGLQRQLFEALILNSEEEEQAGVMTASSG